VSTAFTTPASWRVCVCLSTNGEVHEERAAPDSLSGFLPSGATIRRFTTKVPAPRLGSVPGGSSLPRDEPSLPRLTDGTKSTILRCADRDQAIQDQVGYLVFTELWMGMRDAVRGNERDDVGVDAESSAFLGNVVGDD
jgi:hypothetical protein